NPARDTIAALKDRGLWGKPLGIETATYGLTAANYLLVKEAFGEQPLVEASNLIPSLRVIKSPAELAMVRRAGELADAALERVYETAAAGVEEGVILQ